MTEDAERLEDSGARTLTQRVHTLGAMIVNLSTEVENLQERAMHASERHRIMTKRLDWGAVVFAASSILQWIALLLTVIVLSSCVACE